MFIPFPILQGIQQLMAQRPPNKPTVQNLRKIEKENKTRDSKEPAPPARNKAFDTPSIGLYLIVMVSTFFGLKFKLKT